MDHWQQHKKNETTTSCSLYARRTATTSSEDDNAYTFTANAVNARCCPGCTIRVQRSDGCNHMTCLCGMQWCYVCECRWSNWHYGCRMEDDANEGAAFPGIGCVLS
mmetsp:Transcript_27991/g.41416  ORF Transcript_27991/g.41416 Transcript_27991/m.41416 type:complete len:106 (-) Transcript_27991:39-356(-)